MNWSEIPGWTCPVLLKYYDELAAEMREGIHVEVGVAYGKSLAYLVAKADPNLQILGVDSWLVKMGRGNLSEMDWKWIRTAHSAKHACERYLEECDALWRVELCQGDSSAVAYALDFEVDSVFLDGSHEEAAVRADVAAWGQRLKPGGRMAGHDANDHYPGVARAVRALLPGAEFRPATEAGGWGGVWTWRKPL